MATRFALLLHQVIYYDMQTAHMGRDLPSFRVGSFRVAVKLFCWHGGIR